MNMMVESVLLAEQATRVLRTCLRDLGTCTLAILIDPTVYDPWDELCADRPVQMSRARIPVRHEDVEPGSSPYLIWIDDEECQERLISDVFRISVRECSAVSVAGRGSRSVCGWLPIPGGLFRDASELAVLLGTRAVVSQASERPLYFRFYDPRVMVHLDDILDASQQRALIHPLPVWLYLNDLGEMLSYRPVDSSKGPMEAFRLRREQFPALECIAWLPDLRRQSKSWAMELPPDDAKLMRALRTAQMRGLTVQEDCSVYAACSILLGEQFYLHAYVAGAIEEAAERPGRFASRVAGLSDEQLQEMQRSSRSEQLFARRYS